MSAIAVAPERQLRRTFGSFQPMTPEQVRENAKTFLEEFAPSIVDTCQDKQYDGEVRWSLVNPKPNVVAVEITYVPTVHEGEAPEILPTFQMVVAKRHLGHNMVRLTDKETGEHFFMQADPRLVLAWLAY